MTRSDLTAKLSMRLNVSKREADRYLTCFLDSIMETLAKDGRVVVQGFGSFRLREYNARISKKPISGETIYLPVRRKAVFHAGKELRGKVDKENPLADLVHEISRRPVLETKPVFSNVHGINEPVTVGK